MAHLVEGQTDGTIDTPDVGWAELYYVDAAQAWRYKTSSGTFTFSTGVTREEVEDLLANSFEDTATITWVYDDASNVFRASIESTVLATINSALQSGDNVSELVNDAGYQTAAQVTTAVTTGITNHEAAVDPHPQYLTQAEADALYYPDSNPDNYVDAAGAAAAAPVQSVAGKVGVVSLVKGDVGLNNVDNTSDINKPVSTAQAAADTVVQNFSIQRSNHTGTQVAATISDFAATVRSTVLTGLSLATSTAVVATDSILVAIGKLQAQINLLVFGREFEEFLDTTNVTYTTNTPFEAYSETTQSKPAGKYRVSSLHHYEPGATNANDLFTLRINGTQIGLEYEDEGKDTGGDIRRTVCLVGYYDNPSTGSFDIELWASQDGGGTSVIHGFSAEVWRVE